MNTENKITFQYLMFSILFIGVSFFIAYYFWWRIDLNSAQFFIIVFSVMICWLGIGYLSTLISGKIVLKNIEEIGFISPFTLITNGYYYEKYGLEISKKLKNIFSVIAFPVLFILIAAFYKITAFVEYTDLAYYGQYTDAKIAKTFTDKRGKLGVVNFKFNGNDYSKILKLNDTLKNAGDFESIIFSTRNPFIVESRTEFENKTK